MEQMKHMVFRTSAPISSAKFKKLAELDGANPKKVDGVVELTVLRKPMMARVTMLERAERIVGAPLAHVGFAETL